MSFMGRYSRCRSGNVDLEIKKVPIVHNNRDLEIVMLTHALHMGDFNYSADGTGCPTGPRSKVPMRTAREFQLD